MKRLVCFLRGHRNRCATAVYLQSRTERHVHICVYCGAMTKDVSSPISAEVARLLETVPGLAIDDQVFDQGQEYLH